MLSYTFTYNGYTFNDYESGFSYPYFGVSDVRGFSSPKLRHQQQNLVGLHGFDDHLTFVGGRFLIFRGKVAGDTEAQIFTELASMSEAFAIPGVPTSSNDGYHAMTFTKTGEESKYVNAKVHRLPSITKDMHIHRARDVIIELRCKDPRIYSSTLKTQTFVETYDRSGFPAKMPRMWGQGAGQDVGAVTLVNNGNFSSPPTYRINGPTTDPYVTNVTHDYEQKFIVELLEGEYIDVDVANATATLSDGNDALTYEDDEATWIYVEPGSNVFQFGESNGSGSVTINHRDVWLSAPR